MATWKHREILLLCFVTLLHLCSSSTIHFPEDASGSTQNGQQTYGEDLQARSSGYDFDTSSSFQGDVGSLSRGSSEDDTMYLKSKTKGALWPKTSIKNRIQFQDRRKRSLPPMPLPPFLPPPPPGFPGFFPQQFSKPARAAPRMVRPAVQPRRREQMMATSESQLQPRNGMIVKTIPLNPNPYKPEKYAEDEECYYHTVVNGDSEVLLRKILPIRMRGRTLVRTCIAPIPNAKDPRYKVLLRGNQKHSFGNINLSMKM